jgi:alpha-L-arabinofuranosidase
VEKLTPNSFDDISKGATDNILTDIFNRTGSVQATILPYFSTKYPYTVYMLNIQQGTDVIQWLHDLKEGSWTRNTYKNKSFSCKPKYVFIS